MRGVLRRQRRRLGRLPRADREARLPAVARRRLHLAAAVLQVAAARRRLRHLRLLHDPARLRHGRRRARLHRGRPPARHPRDRRPRHEPHVDRPPVVPGVALERRTTPSATGTSGPTPSTRYEDARIIFTDTETSNWTWDDAGRRVLLAPLLLPPARPQLRQPRGPGGDARGPALLARPRASTASASTPCPTCTSATAPTARTCPRRTTTSSACAPRSTRTTPTACCWPRPTSGRPTSSSTSATATSATWPSTSRSCRACSWRVRREEADADLRDPRARRRRSPTTASGACSCATTTS